jgi:sporulation protein YlmC with PRC-barrel domain
MKMLTHMALFGMLTAAQAGLTSLTQQASTEQSETVVAVKAYRVSKLVGLEIKNEAGEDLGTVNELVLDVESGETMYVAVSVGGVLGVGDKLIAVPWDAFKLKYDETDTYFVLDIAKAKLETAPGFDEDNWPDVADEKWRDEINRYYDSARDKVKESSATRDR